MNKKKIIIFAVCLAGLLAIQIKFFLPFMYDIAASDLFLVESKDAANPMSVSTDMTAMAFSHCNNFIKKNAEEDQNLAFAAQRPTPGAWVITNTSSMPTSKLAARIARRYCATTLAGFSTKRATTPQAPPISKTGRWKASAV